MPYEYVTRGGFVLYLFIYSVLKPNKPKAFVSFVSSNIIGLKLYADVVVLPKMNAVLNFPNSE